MKTILIVSFALLMLVPTVAFADGPTPTPIPERTYSRSDLLSRLAPKPFTIQPLPFEFDNWFGVNTAIEGGSWFLTFEEIMRLAGGGNLLLFLIIVVFAVELLIARIHKAVGARDAKATQKAVTVERKSYDKFLR